jgi:hypothetical protein
MTNYEMKCRMSGNQENRKWISGEQGIRRRATDDRRLRKVKRKKETTKRAEGRISNNEF